MSRWAFERAVLASGLPPPARHLLHVLAVFADWPAGTTPAAHTPSLSRLTESSGYGRSTLARHLNTLERAGWLVRMRPTVEAARGRKERTRYRLVVPASPGDGLAASAEDEPASATEGLATSATEGPETGLTSAIAALASAVAGPDMVQSGTSASATAGHKPDLARPQHAYGQPRGPEQLIRKHTDADDEEAAEVAALIQREKHPDNPAAFVRRLATDGELPEWLDRVRNARDRAGRSAAIDRARRSPECEHGTPGGNHPDYPQCALCRRARQASA